MSEMVSGSGGLQGLQGLSGSRLMGAPGAPRLSELENRSHRLNAGYDEQIISDSCKPIAKSWNLPVQLFNKKYETYHTEVSPQLLHRNVTRTYIPPTDHFNSLSNVDVVASSTSNEYK